MSHQETDKPLIDSDVQSPAAQFFREEAVSLLGLSRGEDVGKELTFKTAEVFPSLPQGKPADEHQMRAYWRGVRNFFRSGNGSADALKGHYPLLLAPYRDRVSWPGHFPLWLAGRQTPEGSTEAPYLPFVDLIGKSIRQFAPQEGAARILKDNLTRLERIIRSKLTFADVAYEAIPVLEESLQELKNELNISGPEGESLEQDTRRLLGAMPRGGKLVAGGAQTPFHLLASFLETHRQKERAALQVEITGLIARLKEMLAVEKEKSPEAQSSDHLQDALDFAGNFLNFEELSSVLPASGSDAMPEERLKRIEKILETLHSANQELLERPASLLIDPAIDNPDWRQDFPQGAIFTAKPEQLCRQVTALYDERMGAYARIFAAIRLAKLEIGGHYRAELHGDFFAHFDWRSFNDQELALCPPILLVADESALLHRELDDFSRLLASDRLIKLYVLKRTVHPESRDPEETLSEGVTPKRELSALAIAHRNVCVVQTTIVDPLFLLGGLQEGLAASSPVLFYIFAPSGPTDTLYLRSSAAVEGRFFPSLLYNSERGPRWGSRFNISQNPQVETDWPRHSMKVKEKDQTREWQAPFTLVDFLAANASFASYFQVVPPEYWQDSFIPLADYLQLDPDAAFDHVPFIWLLDEQGRLQKAAVSWPLVLSCREKLDHWRYLQENAGVHSYHVEKATEKLRLEIEEKFEREKAALQERHRKELEKTVETAARSAMERLAATLLDMDADLDLIGAVPAATKIAPAKDKEKAKVEQPAPQAAAKPAEPEKSKQKPETKKPEEELASEEAWIDTPLCTSCNECINLNKKIFAYDENKQAFVADPKGGPFVDIVKAAENCPVRIIHPGTPQDPNEPGLDELIKRAAPFN